MKFHSEQTEIYLLCQELQKNDHSFVPPIRLQGKVPKRTIWDDRIIPYTDLCMTQVCLFA